MSEIAVERLVCERETSVSKLRSQVEHDIAVREFRYLAIPGSSLKLVDQRPLQTLLSGTETFLENVPDGLRVPGLPQGDTAAEFLSGPEMTVGGRSEAAPIGGI